jgi:ATP-dependent Lhr-like helicase
MELQILARRVANYDPKMLDQLCLTGIAGWGRLSQPSAAPEGPVYSKRRVISTSITPIAFFVREDADWMAHHRGRTEMPALSPAASAVLEFLRRQGASFFADIVRRTGNLKSEVEFALWELVAAGLLTADSFDNLRALIDPKRRSGRGSARSSRPRHSAGRWSLLYSGEDATKLRASRHLR